jgi:hypothetical protein
MWSKVMNEALGRPLGYPVYIDIHAARLGIRCVNAS